MSNAPTPDRDPHASSFLEGWRERVGKVSCNPAEHFNPDIFDITEVTQRSVFSLKSKAGRRISVGFSRSGGQVVEEILTPNAQVKLRKMAGIQIDPTVMRSVELDRALRDAPDSRIISVFRVDNGALKALKVGSNDERFDELSFGNSVIRFGEKEFNFNVRHPYRCPPLIEYTSPTGINTTQTKLGTDGNTYTVEVADMCGNRGNEPDRFAVPQLLTPFECMHWLKQNINEILGCNQATMD